MVDRTDSLLPSAAAQLQPLRGEMPTVCPLHTLAMTKPILNNFLTPISTQSFWKPRFLLVAPCSFLISPLLPTASRLQDTLRNTLQLLVPPSMKGVIPSKKTSAFRSELTFIASLKASCNTLRKSQQLHFDPKRMAVMVRSGSLTHPSR